MSSGTKLQLRVAADTRRAARVRMEAAAYGVWIRLRERNDCHCRPLTEPFPDYRSMLDALTPVTAGAGTDTTLVIENLRQPQPVEDRTDLESCRRDQSAQCRR